MMTSCIIDAPSSNHPAMEFFTQLLIIQTTPHHFWWFSKLHRL